MINMNKTVEDYVHTQLSSAGFVLLEAAIAYQLRPDRWPNLTQCRHHFAAVRPKLIQNLTAAGVQFFQAWIVEAKDPVLGACRSRRDLPRRIEYVLGAPVKVDLVDAGEVQVPAPEPPRGPYDRQLTPTPEQRRPTWVKNREAMAARRHAEREARGKKA